MFEKATKMRLRFETVKGNVTTEDLWDLPLQGQEFSLDEIAKKTYRKLNESKKEKSFVTKESKKDEELALKLDILKRVIEVKLKEQEEAAAKVEAKQKKEKILDILVEKENESLKTKSPEELKKMLNKL